MRRDARILKRKAVASLRRAAAAFNGLDDEGRHTTVLIHLQHAFEMLLKAALHEKRATIVDAATGQSVGFKKCLNLATAQIPLRAEDAGTLRAIDQMRDDEYHYLGLVSEGILFLHLRAAISIFDRILQEVFGETLADQLPARVLPISTQPPEDLQVLIDREYTQVRALLSPGHRQGPEARARIRTLLALEGHVAEDAEVRNSDVTRVERAVRGGSERAAVFPRLKNLTSQTLGLEVSIKVHTTRREGAPVRFVAEGEPGEAGAVRDVDLQARYPFSKTELAQHVKLTAPRTAALRAHLQIDGNAEYHHQFTFGHMTHDGYSHAALRAMREALEGGVDMDAVWAASAISTSQPANSRLSWTKRAPFIDSMVARTCPPSAATCRTSVRSALAPRIHPQSGGRRRGRRYCARGDDRDRPALVVDDAAVASAELSAVAIARTDPGHRRQRRPNG